MAQLISKWHDIVQIDTAYVYTGGTSEKYLGKIDWKGRGLKMETKLYPNTVRDLSLILTPSFIDLQTIQKAIQLAAGQERISHTPEVLCGLNRFVQSITDVLVSRRMCENM